MSGLALNCTLSVVKSSQLSGVFCKYFDPHLHCFPVSSQIQTLFLQLGLSFYTTRPVIFSSFTQSLSSFYAFGKVVFGQSVIIPVPQFVGSLAATFFLPRRIECTMWVERARLMRRVSICVPSALWQRSAQTPTFKTFCSKEQWSSQQGTESNVSHSLYLEPRLSGLAEDLVTQVRLLKWDAGIQFVWGQA